MTHARLVQPVAEMPKKRRRAFVASLCGLLLGVGFGVGGSLVVLAAPASPVSGAEPDGDAWASLAALRDDLRAASPLAASFTQTYVPSGFSTGDAEAGALYLDLPRCLRFEYREPFPKNYLLCGDWVYTWNPEEPSGRRFLVDDSEAEGIDLLRLEIEALRGRYRAEFAAMESDRDVIRLVPVDPVAEISEASVELTRASNGPRLAALAYVDRGGNRTRFEITGYGALETRAAFATPAIEWLDN